MRALSAEQLRIEVEGALSADACYERFERADWMTGQHCVGCQQRLHMLRLSDAGAELDDSIELAEDKQVLSVSAGEGVTFVGVGRLGFVPRQFGSESDSQYLGLCAIWMVAKHRRRCSS